MKIEMKNKLYIFKMLINKHMIKIPKLSALLTRILDITYYPNPQNNPVHEIALKEFFINQDFQEFPSTEKRFNKKEFWKNHLIPNWEKANNIPNNTFISQPFGSQAPPDFIFKYQNILIPLEAKSSEGTRPAYNGTLPHPNCIYAFTSKKYNKHTLFLGKDVVDNEERKFLGTLDKKIKELIKHETEEHRKENPIDKNQRGWYLYFRQKFEQKCGHLSCSNDYFIHPDKKICEKNVIDWVKQLES